SEQPQQIDIRFRSAAADHRALHGMIRALTKALHHAAAHDAPAQRAHDFPEFDARSIHLATGGFVAGEHVFPRAKAADGLVDLAEPPGIDADPAEVLHGIAEMSELPI